MSNERIDNVRFISPPFKAFSGIFDMTIYTIWGKNVCIWDISPPMGMVEYEKGVLRYLLSNEGLL
jgi:hypothetical protein